MTFCTRMVVRLPTSCANPAVGASLKRMTAVCASISAPAPRPASVLLLPTTAHVEKSAACRVNSTYKGENST
eukprot:1195998-Prorocentrum_minimum.AAC.2